MKGMCSVNRAINVDKQIQADDIIKEIVMLFVSTHKLPGLSNLLLYSDISPVTSSV